MAFKTYYHKDYSGGLNDTDSSLEIQRNEASVLRNWDITNKGKLVQRPGLTLTGNAIGSNPIAGLAAFLRDSGKDLIAMEGANMRYLNGATWDTLDNTFSSGINFWLENVQAQGKIFISNEDNDQRYWDRSSIVLNACLTTLPAGTPHGNILRWHKNHMFTINNVNVSGTKYSNRVYWSALNDPLTYDTVNDFFEIPGEGRGITFIDLGDVLVIFKERSIQYLQGWGDASWQITGSSSNVANVDEQVGCVAPLGVTRVGNEAWFVDDEAQIRRLYQTDFDAFRKDIISTKIQGTLSGINKTQLAKAVAFTHNDKVYFAFPNGSDTSNSLICVFDIIASKRTGEEAWTTYTGWFPSFFTAFPTSATPDMYLGSATTGKVYKHAGVDDDGVAIDCRWDGKDDGYDVNDRFKRYAFGYATAESSSSDVNVTLHSSVDQGPYAQLATLNLLSTGSRLGPTGSFLLGPTGNCRLGGSMSNETKFYFTDGGGNPSGKTIRSSVRHNEAAKTAQVSTFTTNYKIRQLR